jgi:hypothetical protein
MQGLHFVTGEKGGIGKSLFAMVLLEYFNNLGIEHKFYDADRTSPDVGLIYGESYDEIIKSLGKKEKPSEPTNFTDAFNSANSDDFVPLVEEFKKEEEEPNNINQPEQVYFSEDQQDSFKADRLYIEACEGNLVVVNLPAQVDLLINRWLTERNIFDNLADNDCNIYYWYLTDGSPESLDLLDRSLKQYGDTIKHIVVRNKGLNKSIDQKILKNPVLQSMRSCGVKTVEMPQLIVSDAEMQVIKTSKLMLSKVMEKENNIPGINFLTKQRIKSFLKHCHIEIDKTTIFAQKLEEGEEPEKKSPNENEVAHVNQ